MRMMRARKYNSPTYVCLLCFYLFFFRDVGKELRNKQQQELRERNVSRA